MKVIEFVSSGLFNLNDLKFDVKRLWLALKGPERPQNILEAIEQIFKLTIIMVNNKFFEETFDRQSELIKNAVLETWNYFSIDFTKRFMKKIPSIPKSDDDKKRVLSLFKNKINAFLKDVQLEKMDEQEISDEYRNQLKANYRTIPNFIYGDFPKIKRAHPFYSFFKHGVFSFKELDIRIDTLIALKRGRLSVEDRIKKALIEIYLKSIHIDKIVADTLLQIFPSEDTINDLFIDYWLRQKFKDNSFKNKHFGYLRNILDIKFH